MTEQSRNFYLFLNFYFSNNFYNFRRFLLLHKFYFSCFCFQYTIIAGKVNFTIKNIFTKIFNLKFKRYEPNLVKILSLRGPNRRKYKRKRFDPKIVFLFNFFLNYYNLKVNLFKLAACLFLFFCFVQTIYVKAKYSLHISKRKF